jgi:hypothetical protein
VVCVFGIDFYAILLGWRDRSVFLSLEHYRR